VNRVGNFLVFVGLLSCVPPALAGIQVAGTRVIYPETEREVTVRIRNDASGPRLLQAWVDDGDSEATAETSKAPFLVTPPISRVDPDMGQALRIIRTGAAALPADRESVFWLNVLEIPPKPKTASRENLLQFAVRTRLKIFYRPNDLPGQASEAYKAVTWTLAQRGERKKLVCRNASAFTVSFASVLASGKEAVLADGGMCPAKGTAEFDVKTEVAPSAQMIVNVINDYGGVDHRPASLQG